MVSLISGELDYESGTHSPTYSFTVRASDATGNIVEKSIVITIIDIPEFYVTFNANGGNGSMSTQKVIGGIPTSLTKNAFTRPSYRFNGWPCAL